MVRISSSSEYFLPWKVIKSIVVLFEFNYKIRSIFLYLLSGPSVTFKKITSWTKLSTYKRKQNQDLSKKNPLLSGDAVLLPPAPFRKTPPCRSRWSQELGVYRNPPSPISMLRWIARDLITNATTSSHPIESRRRLQARVPYNQPNMGGARYGGRSLGWVRVPHPSSPTLRVREVTTNLPSPSIILMTTFAGQNVS
jgi:hypothetical protein